MKYLGVMEGVGQLKLGDSTVPGVNYLIDIFLVGSEKVALGAVWGDVTEHVDRARGALTLYLSDGEPLKVLVEKIQFVRGLTQVRSEGRIPGW